MRFILSFLVLLAFAAPTMAAENNDVQKPTLVKGSKSYQVRYTKSVAGPESVEPAAGVEIQTQKTDHQSAIATVPEDKKSSKMMKLHGKR
jgi:hypothetical protein